MSRIKMALWSVLLLITGLWLLADTLNPQPLTYFSFRSVFMQYSGVIGIGVMSVAMILSVRSRWLEKYLDGLDKAYRLHKWLGITALIVGVVHWWWATGTKWMVGWGWLERPVRRAASSTNLNQIESWLRSQRGLAESIGEWAFYAIVIMIVLALIKRFPYHWFGKTHRWIAVAYLALVYHAVVLIKLDYWLQPIGWLMAMLLLGGSISAILSLAQRIGADRKVKGKIVGLKEFPSLNVLETTVEMENGWQGHKAGQFAFVTYDRHEGAHPYTIASAWDATNKYLVFITKALGDHTNRLTEHLQVGMPVSVEGPYGCFGFDDDKPSQIWIGAGIGITPFIAALKQRSLTQDAKKIYLFHSTSQLDNAAMEQLTLDAKMAGVELHIIASGEQGRLTGDQICAVVPSWQSASVWFCGPAGFGQSLRNDFIARGLPGKLFHQELFQMR